MYDDLPTALLAGPLAQCLQRLAHLGEDILNYIRAVAVCAHQNYRDAPLLTFPYLNICAIIPA